MSCCPLHPCGGVVDGEEDRSEAAQALVAALGVEEAQRVAREMLSLCEEEQRLERFMFLLHTPRASTRGGEEESGRCAHDVRAAHAARKRARPSPM